MSSLKTINTALIGAGPLGINIYKYALTRSDIRIDHVVDIHPAMKGKDMGAYAGLDPTGVLIEDNYQNLEETEVVILATVSDLSRIGPQILQLVELGLPVVTTCEEMFFPWHTSAEWSQRIDEAAEANGVAVLGVCHHVDRIEVRRYQDAQFRRIPFQKKIGAGLTYEEFEVRKNEGSLRHVGLTESMHFIANQLDWKLERTEDKIEPVVADRLIETESLKIQSGQVAGIRQTGRGYVNGEERIRLSFQAAVSEPESYDEIEIFGVPHIRSRIIGGVHGDVATCSIILNACRSVLKAAPGLRTMADVPMITSIGK